MATLARSVLFEPLPICCGLSRNGACNGRHANCVSSSLSDVKSASILEEEMTMKTLTEKRPTRRPKVLRARNLLVAGAVIASFAAPGFAHAERTQVKAPAAAQSKKVGLFPTGGGKKVGLFPTGGGKKSKSTGHKLG